MPSSFAKNESGVRRDAKGRVVAVKFDEHVTDPESPEAVQIPAGTGADATGLEPFAAHDDPDREVVDNNVKVGDRAVEEPRKALRAEDVREALDEQSAAAPSAEPEAPASPGDNA